MNPIFENVHIWNLEAIFQKTQKYSPAPYLKDPACFARAQRRAKKSGLWDSLGRQLENPEPIPLVRRRDYRDFDRTGNRARCEHLIFKRNHILALHGLGLWLKHPAAKVDDFQDIVWAICEETNWSMPAHEYQIAPDLRATQLAADLAEWKWLLADQLEAEVPQRITQEIRRRIFDAYYSSNHRAFWRSVNNNWNHVCLGSLIRTVLYEVSEPDRLADMLYGPIREMKNGLDGFADDGSCTESIGYWGFGFGHYLQAALALFNRTNGEINIMDHPKVEACCRYPLAAFIDPPAAGLFGDAGHTFISQINVQLINQFFDIPELYSCCAESAASFKFNLKSTGVPPLPHNLSLPLPKKIPPYRKEDNVLEIGLYKLNSASGKNQTTLMGLAGHNDFNHNHNDVGSYILYRDGVCWLTDPGSPVYNRDTFSKKRYENPYINSTFHSVPRINGKLQGEGKKYYGTLALKNMGGEFPKQATIKMQHAYPRGTAQKISRNFELAKNGELLLTQRYLFKNKPKSLEEVFITFETTCVSKDKQSVTLKNGRKKFTISAIDSPGHFSVHSMLEDSKLGRDERVVQRIVFKPKTLHTDLTLKFQMR